MALGLAIARPGRSRNKPSETATCGDHGTSVHFEKTPSDAARKALKEEKLVLRPARFRALRRPGLHLKQRRGAPCERPGQSRSRQVSREVLRRRVPERRHLQIVGKAKQGGNVATYFCAPDGRVLHAIAGPVDAGTMLREAKWVVETATKGASRRARATAPRSRRHAQGPRRQAAGEHGLVVEPVTFDPPDAKDNDGALTYRDPTGRPLAPCCRRRRSTART